MWDFYEGESNHMFLTAKDRKDLAVSGGVVHCPIVQQYLHEFAKVWRDEVIKLK